LEKHRLKEVEANTSDENKQESKEQLPAAKSSLKLGTPFLLREEEDCTYIETKI